MPKYAVVEEAARYCWGKNFMNVFKDFFSENADLFFDAPPTISGEQNLVYYSLYQKYLKLYETTLSEYIASLDVSIGDFYAELKEIMEDPSIKDKKLLHFVNYLVASTDYESFYKIMGRAAKKARKSEGINVDGGINLKADCKEGESKSSNNDSKAFDRDDKYSHK